MKAPTEAQTRKLLVLGDGAMVVAPRRREWGPLLRRGWVVAQTCGDNGARFLPPLRITPAGLRALADGIEAHGLPEIPLLSPPQQLDEDPRITALKEQLATARAERDEQHRARCYAEQTIRRVRAALPTEEKQA